MTTFEQIGPNTWRKPADRGWVVYVQADAYYYPEDQKDEAQARYDQAIKDGKWASPPKPAHTGG